MSRDRRVLSVVNMNKPSKNSSDFYLTPLAAAVRSNDVKTVEKLLDADELAVREELMWRYGRNRTLLFAPVVAGHVHMVRLLIERGGADFETRDTNQFTPLGAAMRAGMTDTATIILDKLWERHIGDDPPPDHAIVAQLLVKYSVFPDTMYTDGLTPMHYAIVINRIGLFYFLMKKLPLESVRRMTAICWLNGCYNVAELAAFFGRPMWIKYVLQAQCLPSDHPSRVKLLITSARRGYSGIDKPYKDCPPPSKPTPLDVLPILLEAWPDMATITTNGGQNLQMLVSMDSKYPQGRLRCFRVLQQLNKGGGKHRDDDGRSVLWHAAKNGLASIVQEILGLYEEDDPEDSDDSEPSPLWVACNAGHTDSVTAILASSSRYGSKEAQIHNSRNDFTTPLQVAVIRGHAAVVNAFKKAKALNAAEIYKTCAQFGRADILLKLMDSDSDDDCNEPLSEKDVEDLLCLAVESDSIESLKAVIDKFDPGESLSKVADVVASRQSQSLRQYFHMPSNDPNESPLVRMSHKFPVFSGEDLLDAWSNEVAIHLRQDKFSTGIEDNEINLNDLNECILGEFCLDFSRRDPSLTLEEMNPHGMECTHDAPRSDACLRMKSVIASVCLLETQLRQDPSSRSPRFCPVGSVVEGTKVGIANELDLTVRFDPAQFRNISAEQPFQFSNFLSTFLDSIAKALRAIESQLPPRLSVKTGKCRECSDLVVSSADDSYAPYGHCSHFVPSVTHGKIRACVSFLWDDTVLVSVDLVPLIPVPEGFSFASVMKYLIQTKPPFWTRHLRSIIEYDRQLPEMTDCSEETVPEDNCVVFKVLHYGPGMDNFVPRPSIKSLGIAKLQNGPLKHVYRCFKVLKDLLSIPVKSYVAKKILLRPEMVMMSEVSIDKFEILYELLTHNEVKRAFEDILDFDWLGRKLVYYRDNPDDRHRYLPIRVQAIEAVTLKHDSHHKNKIRHVLCRRCR